MELFLAPTNPLITAIACCLISIALESVFSGTQVRRRLAELRAPKFALPVSAWIVIGLLYYACMFFVIYRVAGWKADPSRQTALLWLIYAVMLLNAGWNFFFFRSRNLALCFYISVGYSMLVIVLLVLLFLSDPIAAWTLTVYAVYLIYGGAWGLAIWRLNR